MTTTDLPKPAWASAVTTAAESGKPKSFLLYGDPGTRKTSIAASIILVDGFEKVLFIDIDQGTEVLAQNPMFAAIDILTLNPLEARSKDKLDAVIKDVTENDYGYDAVILDTLDVAQDVAEKHFKNVNPNPNDGFYIYRELGVWTDEIVRKMHTSPHFTAIITAHSSDSKTKSGGVRTLPRLSGSSKDAIGGIPSVVAYLEYADHPQTGERHLIATVGESDNLVSKNRFGFPPQIVDPDMPRFYNIIKERIGKPADASAIK